MNFALRYCHLNVILPIFLSYFSTATDAVSIDLLSLSEKARLTGDVSRKLPLPGGRGETPRRIVAEGFFSAAAPTRNVEGFLCHMKVSASSLSKTCGENGAWIGWLHDNRCDDNFHGCQNKDNVDSGANESQESSKMDKTNNCKKSLTEQMREIIVLGASALIIIVNNAASSKEFDIVEVFSKPVVLLFGGENATKIMNLFSMNYDIYLKIQRHVPHVSVAGTIGTITLWATCGRSTSGTYHEWQGTVCIGNNDTKTKFLGDVLTWHPYFILMVYLCLCCIFYINAIIIYFQDVIADKVCTQGVARHILARMRVETYRSHGRTSRKKSNKFCVNGKYCIARKKFENAPDECAICLDSFFPLQTLRVLPCNHSFHISCIDKWFATHHTCPMCNFNILGKNSAIIFAVSVLMVVFQTSCKEADDDVIMARADLLHH